MKFYISSIIVFLFSIFTGNAQPEPCLGNPQMTSTCIEACVICDIDGFKGRNNYAGQGQIFSGFCTTYNHNMNYIAFVAGTVDLTINVTVSNCNKNTGLEIGLWESLDCKTFTKVSICDTDVRPNTTVAFSNTKPLVVGQHYYLIMDGSNGDVCDWQFNVVEGSTAVGLLTTSGIISGKDILCPDLESTYSTTGDVGANIFFWTVNGVAQNSFNKDIDITFPSDGKYEICVTATNVCDEAPPTCTFIDVVTPKINKITETVCDNNCLEVADTVICTSGNYIFKVAHYTGCDSIIIVDLTVLPQAKQFIDINLCVGEEFFIGNTPYATTGVFMDTILTAQLCDSIVTLDLFMIECEIRGSTGFIQPICKGDANGFLIFSVENGTPPFNYTWEHITNSNIFGTGSTNLFIDNQIVNVPAGYYEINIMDGFGNDVVLFQEVTEPQSLAVDVDALDIDGYNLSCNQGNDGVAFAIGNGGVKPYSFLWNTNEAGDTLKNLSAGVYSVKITDASGCIRNNKITLIEPSSVQANVNYIDPNCDGLETGIINVDTVLGGTPPYLFAFNNSPYSSQSLYENLPGGNYTFYIKDNNDCIKDTINSLSPPDIPVLYMGSDLFVDLGCDILLPVTTNNTNLININWRDITFSLDCDTCLRPKAKPFNDSKYILTVTSIDDCMTSDSLYISVNKVRDIYFPNVFSPNGDGINDHFIINATKSVALIKSMKVLDRWGNLVYNVTNHLPNVQDQSWDGKSNGQIVSPGVFLWVAEVEYLDGQVLQFSGDLTVVK